MKETPSAVEVEAVVRPRVYAYTLAICASCGNSIKMGLCTYGCQEDAEHEKDRKKVLWRTFRVTEEIIKEWMSK